MMQKRSTDARRLNDIMTSPSSSNGRLLISLALTCACLLGLAWTALLPTWLGAPSGDDVADWLKWLGRFHPVVLHLPIGILIWVLAHELIVMCGGKLGTSLHAVGMVAFSAIAASTAGMLLYYSTPDYDGELIHRHLNRGIAFTCLIILSFLVKIWVDFAAGRGAWLFRGLLLGSSGMMAVASHDGGSLTHGSDYLTEFTPAPLRQLAGMPLAQVDPNDSVELADQSVYASIIAPIFEAKCVQCHQADKMKGRFRMDQYELLLAGGKEGEAIIPGDAAASNLLVRIELPEDDDEHMPPEGKIDLSTDEVALIRWWIDQGASEDQSLRDMEIGTEVQGIIDRLLKKSSSHAGDETSMAPQPPDARLLEIVSTLQNEFPAALRFESRGSSALTFNAAGLRGRFSDADLAKLDSVMPRIVAMDLSGTLITDASAEMLAKAASLKSLHLAETSITNLSLAKLSSLKNLSALNLHGTQINNDAIGQLSKLRQLRKLYLWQTEIDAAGAEALRQQLSGCEIVMGDS